MMNGISRQKGETMDNREQQNDKRLKWTIGIRVLVIVLFAACWPLYKGISYWEAIYAGILCLQAAGLCSNLAGLLVKDKTQIQWVRNLKRGIVFFVLPLAGLVILYFHYPVMQNIDSADAAGKTEASEETAETESYDSTWDSENYVYHRVTEDPAHPYVDAVTYTSAEEIMKNRIISPQVLYEDGDYKLELTGFSFRDRFLLLHTTFTNHSDRTVSACAESYSLFANDYDRTDLIRFGSSNKLGNEVHAGESADSQIRIACSDIPFYDPFLNKVVFRLDVWDPELSPYPEEESLIMETDPITLYTEASDGKDNGFDVMTGNGVKILYDSEEVRVIRTEIKGFLSEERGREEPGKRRKESTWKILVENKTDQDIIVDHRSCTVNGWKALSNLLDEDYIEPDEPEEDLLNEFWEVEQNRLPKIIRAGRRREVCFCLDRPFGFDPKESSAEGRSGTDFETDEEIDLESWPLDEIKTATAEFDVSYTDSSGERHSIHIKDTFTAAD